jgi:hypothetical protein
MMSFRKNLNPKKHEALFPQRFFNSVNDYEILLVLVTCTSLILIYNHACIIERGVDIILVDIITFFFVY